MSVVRHGVEMRCRWLQKAVRGIGEGLKAREMLSPFLAQRDPKHNFQVDISSAHKLSKIILVVTYKQTTNKGK